jgi:hypothetical protein
MRERTRSADELGLQYGTSKQVQTVQRFLIRPGTEAAGRRALPVPIPASHHGTPATACPS